MVTKCAKCKFELQIECPLCYVANIKGKFFCFDCYYKVLAEERDKNHPPLPYRGSQSRE